MANTEYRAVTRFLTMERETGRRIHKRMCIAYGDSTPSYATVKRWIQEFKRGRKHLGDESLSGRPVTATSPENIDAVDKIVLCYVTVVTRQSSRAKNNLEHLNFS